MKFVITKKKPTKNNPELDWKVKLRSYKKEDLEKALKKNPNHKSKSVESVLPTYEWARYGFHENMTIEEARDLAKQLNSQTKLEDERRARKARVDRLNNEQLIDDAFLPERHVRLFEEWLMEDIGALDEEEFKLHKKYSHWRTSQKVIRDIKLPSKKWKKNKKRFYNYFIKKGWSVSYVDKIIGMLNRWSEFYAEEIESYPYKLPHPVGKDKQLINNGQKRKSKKSKESKPLMENELEKLKDKLSDEQFNWMMVAFFFGLRPLEVDNISRGEEYFKIEKQGRFQVLCIFQTKLVAFEDDERWKRIPCLLEGQKKALKIIKAGTTLKRPLVKTLERYLGEGYNTYCGRKGFEYLMRSYGAKFESISSYLGHKDLNRTWKNYTNKEKAYIDEEVIKKAG